MALVKNIAKISDAAINKKLVNNELIGSTIKKYNSITKPQSADILRKVQPQIPQKPKQTQQGKPKTRRQQMKQNKKAQTAEQPRLTKPKQRIQQLKESQSSKPKPPKQPKQPKKKVGSVESFGVGKKNITVGKKKSEGPNVIDVERQKKESKNIALKEKLRSDQKSRKINPDKKSGYSAFNKKQESIVADIEKKRPFKINDEDYYLKYKKAMDREKILDTPGVSSSIRPETKGQLETPAQREKYEETLRKEKQKIQEQKTKQETITNNLDEMDAKGVDGGAQGAWITAKSLTGSVKNHYLDPVEGVERRKAAYKGTFQAAAVSAGGHAGLAVLSGDDPWEAAKTGAFRGALAGGGYYTMKGATGANADSVWGNMKQIGTRTKEMYKATTIKGREEFRKNGMSESLSTLLSAQSGMAESAWFRSKKGNTTTQKVMNSQ